MWPLPGAGWPDVLLISIIYQRMASSSCLRHFQIPACTEVLTISRLLTLSPPLTSSSLPSPSPQIRGGLLVPAFLPPKSHHHWDDFLSTR